MTALAEIAGFLLEHADLIQLVAQALEGGAPKDALMEAIRKEMVAAADAQMKLELGA